MAWHLFAIILKKLVTGADARVPNLYVHILFTLCSLFVRFLFTLGAHFVLTKCSLGAYYGSCWAAGRPGSIFARQWVTPQRRQTNVEKQMAQV